MAKLSEELKPIIYKRFEKGHTAHEIAKSEDRVSRRTLYYWFRQWNKTAA